MKKADLILDFRASLRSLEHFRLYHDISASMKWLLVWNSTTVNVLGNCKIPLRMYDGGIRGTNIDRQTDHYIEVAV